MAFRDSQMLTLGLQFAPDLVWMPLQSSALVKPLSVLFFSTCAK